MANSPSSAVKSTRITEAPEKLETFQKAFLLEAGKLLSSSLDYEKTLSAVADLVVPRLADYCSINIVKEDGSVPPLAIAHTDPAKAQQGWQFQKLYPPRVDVPSGLATVLATRKPLLISEVTEEVLKPFARDEQHMRSILDLGLRSLIVTPLIARDEVLGAVTLVSTQDGKRYRESDVQFAMELSNRAAMAIDNARLYRELQRVAQEKEEALTMLHEVLRQMPFGVTITNPSGDVLLRNDIANEFWKTTHLHPNGKAEWSNYFNAFHPDGRVVKKDEWPIMRALNTGRPVLDEEFEIKKVDGQRSVLSVNASPIRDKAGNVIAGAVVFEDITTKKSAESALKDSEAKFRTLAEVAPCSIFIHDGERLLYSNRATSEITGYGKEELLDRSFWSMLHPDSVPYIRERMRLRAEGRSVPEQFEAKIVTKTGVTKTIEFNGALFDFEGKQAVICIALDITERHQAEEELQRNRERIRLASESAGIATWEWNIRENTVNWSPELPRVIGMGEGASLGSTFDSLLSHVHPDDKTHLRESIERAAAEHHDLNVEFRTLRGEECCGWAFAKAKIFYGSDGTPETMVGVAVDITGSKAAEQAMRETEERFRVTFNQAAVGMAHVSLDGTLLMINHKLAEIFGYDEEEIFGHRFHEFTHPEDLPGNVEKLESMLAGECSSYKLEKRYIRKNGTQIWAQVTSSLVKDEQGAPKYIIAVIEDITERRFSAEALRNSEKLAATGRLAASIAHEINNPLEAVTNLLYLLEQNKSLDVAAKGYTRMAQEEIGRVAHIARQTLGFYRDSTSVESVRLTSLMDDVLSLFDRKIRTSDVTVVKEYETDMAVEAMPGEIRQVLSNLLANALDAAGKKGKLRVRVSRARNWSGRGIRGVRVSIADNGVGIAPQNREHLFEPFFTTKGAKGTGLGLWVTRGMVEKHSGSIRVWSSTSPTRRGTVFSIFLPLKQKRGPAVVSSRRVN